jgi:DNA-binding transcriptional LysR family regulator
MSENGGCIYSYHLSQFGIDMDTLTNMKTFVAVANYGGFSEAARRLHVVPSVVAKRIDQLEKSMGARLFERSTRSVVLTEAGQRLKGKASGVMADFDDLVHSVQRDDSKLEGHIRVMAPTTLTMLHLGRVFTAFMAQHDRITMDISLVDLSTNPEEQGFDLAISGRSASYEGVVDVPLCSASPVLVAAPSYLERRGAPTHPRELIEHACLVFAPTGRTWQFQSSRGALAVDVVPRLTVDDNLTLLGAVKVGMGIAPLPNYVARQAILDGELVPLLASFPLQENWFRAFIPQRKYRLARVKALVDWLLSAPLTPETAWSTRLTSPLPPALPISAP